MDAEVRNTGQLVHRDETRLLRAVDVALRLNISRALAYRLMQNGAMPVVRINRSIRVRSGDLEAYILKSLIGS